MPRRPSASDLQACEARSKRLYLKVLKLLNQRLTRAPANIDIYALLKAAEVTMKGAVMAHADGKGAPQVQVNVVQHLEELAGNLEPLLRRRTLEDNHGHPVASLGRPGRHELPSWVGKQHAGTKQDAHTLDVDGKEIPASRN